MVSPSDRKTPPKTEEDHAYIWTAAEKAHEAWFVVGPLVAIAKNWKGILGGLTVGLILGGERILQALGVMP